MYFVVVFDIVCFNVIASNEMTQQFKNSKQPTAIAATATKLAERALERERESTCSAPVCVRATLSRAKTMLRA